MVKPYEKFPHLIKKNVIHHYWAPALGGHWMLMEIQKGFEDKNLWWGYAKLDCGDPDGEYGTIDKDELDEACLMRGLTKPFKCVEPHTMGNFKDVCDACNIHLEN